jgi:phage gp46-like protein
VILSLLLDAPARDGDDVPAGAPQRGFWGDAYPLVTGDVWGSRLWLLERGKVNTETLLQAREICAQALQWMIDDGVAESIEIQNSWLLGRPGYMRILVGVQRPEDLAPSLFGPWDVYYGEV